METIFEYLNKIKSFSYRSINEIKGKSSEFSDFEAVNFFIIKQAIEKKINLFFQKPELQNNNLYYFPLIKSLVLFLLLKNYSNNLISFEIYDWLLDKNGDIFEIIYKNIDNITIMQKFTVNNNIINICIDDLRKYIFLNKNEFSETKLKSINKYTTLLKKYFNLENDFIPSKFLSNLVIIIEEKNIHQIKGIEILKQIPTQWVKKDGKFGQTTIPIEPMIYIMFNYESLKNQLIDKGKKIETVVLLGDNICKNFFKDIKKDINKGYINNSILVCSKEINEDMNFIYWKWTYQEYTFYNNISFPEIKNRQIPDDLFSIAISKYDSFLLDLEKAFSINLEPLFNNKYLFSLVFPYFTNQEVNYKLKYLRNIKISEMKFFFEEEFFNKNIDSKVYIDRAIYLINDIFNSFRNQKFNFLEEIKENSIFVVPDGRFPSVENWNSILEKRNIKVISFDDLYKKFTKSSFYAPPKQIYFLSLFGHSNPIDFIYPLMQGTHSYVFISYPKELEIIEKIKVDFFNKSIKEYYSESRMKLTGINVNRILPDLNKQEDFSSLIKELNLISNREMNNYNYQLAYININLLEDKSCSEFLNLREGQYIYTSFYAEEQRNYAETLMNIFKYFIFQSEYDKENFKFKIDYILDQSLINNNRNYYNEKFKVFEINSLEDGMNKWDNELNNKKEIPQINFPIQIKGKVLDLTLKKLKQDYMEQYSSFKRILPNIYVLNILFIKIHHVICINNLKIAKPYENIVCDNSYDFNDYYSKNCIKILELYSNMMTINNTDGVLKKVLKYFSNKEQILTLDINVFEKLFYRLLKNELHEEAKMTFVIIKEIYELKILKEDYREFNYLDDFIYLKSKCKNTSINGNEFVKSLNFEGSFTDWGNRNITRLLELISIYLNYFHLNYGKNFFQYFCDKYNNSNFTYNDFLELRHFYKNENDFDSYKQVHEEYIEIKRSKNNVKRNLFYNIPEINLEHNYKVINPLLRFALIDLSNKIIRNCENALRKELNLPLIGEGWFSETELYYKLKKEFPNEEVVNHGRPSWLSPQHLDIFFPKRNIAIEYQGEQHQRPIEYFGGEQSFIKQQERDKRKFELCKENNCFLIYVYGDYIFKEIIEQINTYLEKLNF